MCTHICVGVYIYTRTHACMGAHTHVCIHVSAYIQLILSHYIYFSFYRYKIGHFHLIVRVLVFMNMIACRYSRGCGEI